MHKLFLLSLLALSSSIFADLNQIGEIATKALKECDFVVIGILDDNGIPTAVIKGKGNVVQRYSLKDIPVKVFPQNGQVYAFNETDGVFIDNPELEQKIREEIKSIK
jgi:hypothetical protein